MSKQTIARRCLGVNNRVSPDRLKQYSYRDETYELAAGENIKVEKSYEPVRADGYRKMTAMVAPHSLFCDSGECLICDGTSLYSVQSDYTLRGVRPSLSGQRMCYFQYGDRIYYSDGVSKNGYVLNSVSAPWTEQKYLQATDRHFTKAPIAAHMDLCNGRAYISPVDRRDIIYWSEKGQIGLFNPLNFRRFESEVIMIAAVRSGLFVSTRQRTVFLRIGETVSLEPVVNYPAVEHSLCHRRTDSKTVGNGRIWLSTEGAFFGADTGEFKNLTKERIIIPASCTSSGAALVHGDFLYQSYLGV